MPIQSSVSLLKRRRTKIIATLGPASHDPDTIAHLIRAGVDIFRLNMSHGDHAGHRTTFERVCKAASEAGVHVGVLADLSGPKIRVGVFPDGPITLEEGAKVTVTTRDVPGAPGLIPSQYEALARDVKARDRILLADGVMELRVDDVNDTEIVCTVVQGGQLSDRKGINLPGVNVSAPSLTDKDRHDAKFALDLGVDFLALSFVRTADDLRSLKVIVETSGREVGIIAKIERPEALENSEDILQVADAIMVARGDLGVELPPEQVPVAQRELIDVARRNNKPVIVATQMLESMIDNARPTRAEVADVSHSVASGADAVMLSAETASGAHPRLAVQMMDRVARQMEGYLWDHGAFGSLHHEDLSERPRPMGDAVGDAVALLSRDLQIRMILVVSQFGRSAATLSSARPSAPVIALSDNEATCRRMALLWGVVPLKVDATVIEDPTNAASGIARDLDLAPPGENMLLVRGFNADPEKNTPSVTVFTVTES